MQKNGAALKSSETKESEAANGGSEPSNRAGKDLVASEIASKPSVVVQPPGWGGGRSFADVLAM